MSFAEIRFSTNLSRGSGGYSFKNIISSGSSGLEGRVGHTSIPLFVGDIGSLYVDEKELEYLITFFNARKGRSQGFRYKYHADYSCTNTPLVLDNYSFTQGVTIPAIADGTTKVFQACKLYNNCGEQTVKPLYKIVPSTAKVYVDGVQQTNSTVDVTTGKISFSSPPPVGKQVTHDCEFDLPVRFDIDELVGIQEVLDIRTEEKLYTFSNLPIVEYVLSIVATNNDNEPPEPPKAYGWIMAYWTMAISTPDATQWQQLPGQTPEFADPFDQNGCYCLMKNEQGLIVGVGYNYSLYEQLDPTRSSGGLINSAVSYDGGRNWTCCTQLVSESEDGTYSEGGAYGNGIFVIAGDAGHLWTSTNGLNWQTRYGHGITQTNENLPHNNLTNDLTSKDYHTCAAFGNNTFMAGTDTGVIRRSTDNGTTWQTIWICPQQLQRLQRNFIPNWYRIKSFAYGSGHWIAVIGWTERYDEPANGSLSLILSSTDNGNNWQDITSNVPVTGYKNYFGGEIRFIQGRFYFAGDEGKITTSSDGINWVLMPNNPLDVAVTPIIPRTPGSFVDDRFGTISALAYNSSQNIILFARSDGVLAIYNLTNTSWTPITDYDLNIEYLERFYNAPLFLLEAGEGVIST